MRGAKRLFSERCYPRVSTTSRERWLSAFRVFPGFPWFCAADTERQPSLVRRDHLGSERKPHCYVRTPNVSRTNSPTLTPETTHGLTRLPLSCSLVKRVDDEQP